MVRHHIASRLVLKASHVISPLKKGLERAELGPGRVGLVAPNYHVVLVVLNLELFIDLQTEGVALVEDHSEVLVWILGIGSLTLVDELT